MLNGKPWPAVPERPRIKRQPESGMWTLRCPGSHGGAGYRCDGITYLGSTWVGVLSWLVDHQLFYEVGRVGRCERCKQCRPLFPHVQKRLLYDDDLDIEHCRTCTCDLDVPVQTETTKRRLCMFCHQDEPLEIEGYSQSLETTT